MGQFVGCIQGIGEACRALDFPIVSGNVSLYNETNGTGILPTPAIGGVGLLPDIAQRMTVAFKAAGEAIVVSSEEHTSELQSLMRISYAVFCLKKIKKERDTCNMNHTNNIVE